MLPALYHAHHARHMEDLPFWLKLASQAGDPLLELGCGTGRLLIPLAQGGHRCFGLDHDLEMLNYLKTSLSPHLQLELFILAADISNFRFSERFHLILLPCNTFSTLQPHARQACLACVRRQLIPGGLFAVSLPNPQLWQDLPDQPDPVIEEEFILPATGNPVQVSSAWRQTGDAFRLSWVYDQLFPDGRLERMTVETVHYRIPADEAVGEISTLGFRVMQVYGDYDASPYVSGSPNLVIVAAA
jgi:SAM-dependent methyltransferase